MADQARPTPPTSGEWPRGDRAQVGGRIAIALGRRRPVWWAGVLGVAAGRVIEAMEIGHNVLHGQYDWMRDPPLRLVHLRVEHDRAGGPVAPRPQRRHHVNANVAGIDRDLGYGVVRITDDQPWTPAHLGNPIAAMFLALLFDQAIGFYDLEAERQALGPVDPGEARAKFEASLAKLKRQVRRDFVLVPLLAGRAGLGPGGQRVAQVLGNVWASPSSSAATSRPTR